MVSVIIPCHNAEKYIRQAIESVMVQKVETELIIIDDASNDKSKDIIESYKNYPNVTLIFNSKNQGVAASRNAGVKLAKGEFIAFLDADDYWKENKLEKQIKQIEQKNALFSYTARKLITEEGKETEKIIPVNERCTYDMLRKHNQISCSSVLMKREIAMEFLMEHDEVHEDYLTWLRFLKKYETAYGINEPLLYYRLSENGKSRNKFKSAKMTYGVHRYMGDGRWKSFYNMSSHLLFSLKKYK